MITKIIIFLTIYLRLSTGTIYDSYYGVPVTEERLQEFIAANAVDTCTNDIESCDENEPRRVDGSCNNLMHPTYGAFHTPQIRLLPAEFGDNYEPRKTASGAPFMPPRQMRKALLGDGKGIHEIFNQFVALDAEYMTLDSVSTQDISNYLLVTTHCCTEEGETDYMCTPLRIAADDPVHRFSGYRCVNQTRPIAFQNQGCVSNTTTPERLDFTTPTWDLSRLYAFGDDVILQYREYEGGRLKTEIVDGREFPSDGNSSCTMLQAIETGCASTVPNGLMGTNIFTVLYWRLHNLIARKLEELNPHWDDDKLFYTARDINIGMFVQKFFYEFWPLLLGKDNMVKNNIIAEENSGYRDFYDVNVPTKMYLEYAYVSRWFHTIQEGTVHKMTPNGTYAGDIEVVDNSNRIFDLAVNNTLRDIIHGCKVQPGGGHDYLVDPSIGERGLGPLQNISDVCAQDANKARYFGMARYIEYRDMCTNYEKKHETWEDLEYIIPKENLELLQSVFEVVEDIDLWAGQTMEKHIEGGHIPDTVACVIMKQLNLSMTYDRHWYERADRPNAFTPDQLNEIRKSTLAGLLCAVGDDVSSIQPQAYLRVSPDNEVVSCDEIPQVDLSYWKEELDDSSDDYNDA